MSTILAIETSSDLASAALLCGNSVIARESAGVLTHSHAILPMVQGLLAEAGMSLRECDAVAFGCGPGSFTGVRTACGIAQGLAFGLALPVVPVVTLLAMAHACRAVSGASDVLAILDARMGEVYWAQYRYVDGWQEVIAPTLSPPAAVTPQGQVTACGNGVAAYAADFAHTVFAADAQSTILPRAEQVALLARVAFAHGLALHARDAQPLYLRNKVALTTIERQAHTKVAA
jgi:tRNA threonylcarbamoyladenosine biosynthesis protein TsaB